MSVLPMSEAISMANVYGSELFLHKDQILMVKYLKKLREKATEVLCQKSHLIYSAYYESNKQEAILIVNVDGAELLLPKYHRISEKDKTNLLQRDYDKNCT